MSVWSGLVEAVFPAACVCCDAVLLNEAAFCERCAPFLLDIGPWRCGRCGEPGRFPRQLCPKCRACRPAFHRAYAPYEHDGAVARAIHRFKYEDRPDLAGPLGELLFQRAGDFLSSAPTVVCPIPLHQARYRERRYDQATLLATELCLKSPHLTLADHLLTRLRPTTRQVGLSDEQRIANLRGAFRAHGEPHSVLLVDDVITTGATASAAARALRLAGVKRVEVLALCRARRVLPS